jgi:hypothetical protein
MRAAAKTVMAMGFRGMRANARKNIFVGREDSAESHRQWPSNSTDGITLHVHGDKIRIKGRNLNAEVRPEVRLFQRIASHRVAWVREVDRAGAINGGERATIVKEIVW